MWEIKVPGNWIQNRSISGYPKDAMCFNSRQFQLFSFWVGIQNQKSNALLLRHFSTSCTVLWWNEAFHFFIKLVARIVTKYFLRETFTCKSWHHKELAIFMYSNMVCSSFLIPVTQLTVYCRLLTKCFPKWTGKSAPRLGIKEWSQKRYPPFHGPFNM